MTGRIARPHCSGLKRLLLVLGAGVTVVLLCAGTALAESPVYAGDGRVGAAPDVDEQILAQYSLSLTQLQDISDGYPDGFWRPYEPVTRAQFAKFVVNGFGLSPTVPAEATFLDVPSTHPLYGYVEAAAAAGMIKGRGDGLFAPEESITRQEAAAVVVRLLVKRNDRDLNAVMPDDVVAFQLGLFSDGTEVEPSLEKEVALAVARSCLKGTISGDAPLLNPNDSVTRLQAVALALRQEKPGLSATVGGVGGFFGSIAHLIGEGVLHGVTSWGLEKAYDALFGNKEWEECGGPQFLDRCVSLSRPSHLEDRNGQTHQPQPLVQGQGGSRSPAGRADRL